MVSLFRPWLARCLYRSLYHWYTSIYRAYLTAISFRVRRLFGCQPKQLEVYLSLNDPYSYLLIQALASFQHQHKLADQRIDLRLIFDSSELNSPAWRKHAINDVNAWARLYQLLPITTEPSYQSLTTGQQLWQLQPNTLDNALALFKQTWSNGFVSHFPPSTPVINFLIKNQQRQIKKGYYYPASMFYKGQWYQGVERLYLLQNQLYQTGIIEKPAHDMANGAEFLKQQLLFQSVAKPMLADKQACICYLSITTIYSYLLWIQLRKLAHHYGFNVTVKLLLPDAVGELRMATAAFKYVVFDSVKVLNNEQLAKVSGCFVATKQLDLVYQLFAYVKAQGKEAIYLDAVFDALFVKGQDLSIIPVIANICQQIGIDFEQAIAASASREKQTIFTEYQQELAILGVNQQPCVIYADTICFGADNLFQIEQAILATVDGS